MGGIPPREREIYLTTTPSFMLVLDKPPPLSSVTSHFTEDTVGHSNKCKLNWSLLLKGPRLQRLMSQVHISFLSQKPSAATFFLQETMKFPVSQVVMVSNRGLELALSTHNKYPVKYEKLYMCLKCNKICNFHNKTYFLSNQKSTFPSILLSVYLCFLQKLTKSPEPNGFFQLLST